MFVDSGGLIILKQLKFKLFKEKALNNGYSFCPAVYKSNVLINLDDAKKNL